MEFSEFILTHDSVDIATLALQRSRLAKEVSDWDLALCTLEARRKLKAKLPSWYAIPSLWYPLPLSAEQCSSEETALYKASLLTRLEEGTISETVASRPLPPAVGPSLLCGRGWPQVSATVPSSGLHIADITGGLGVDAWAFSKVCEKVLYNEMKPELARAAEHNFKLLGADNIVVRNCCVGNGGRFPVKPGMTEGKGITEDEGMTVREILGDFEPDVIFMDPARRDDVGRKVFMLEDCSPNVLELLPELYEACPRIMLKLSPMADITAVCRQLPGVKEVHVVEADGECKELLLILEKGFKGQYGLFLYANASVAEITWTQPGNDGGEDLYHCRRESAISDKVLFVPGKGLMKTGAFRWPETFGLKQLAASTHMYTGEAKVPELEPFGKFYSIVETVPLSNKSIKEIGKKYPQADVTARNIPITSDELRKRLGVKPSDGTVHIFGLLSDYEGRILIVSVISK